MTNSNTKLNNNNPFNNTLDNDIEELMEFINDALMCEKEEDDVKSMYQGAYTDLNDSRTFDYYMEDGQELDFN